MTIQSKSIAKKGIGFCLFLAMVFGFILNPTNVTPVVNAQTPKFSDIKGHWAENTITWGVERGIIGGYEDGTFKPDKNVTEAEFLTMLLRGYKPETKGGGSVHWADGFYSFAKTLNLPLQGQEDISKRDQIINRQQVALIVSASQGVHYNGDDAIRYLYGTGITTGTDPANKTIKSYNGQGLLTRAEALQFIKNVLEKGKPAIQARPLSPSDTKLLPNIPIGDDPSSLLDLPYQPPAGWVPPQIKSSATEDHARNIQVLANELGLFTASKYAAYFNVYGKRGGTDAITVGESPTEDQQALITFKYWMGGKNVPEANKVPYITREVFQFYFPSDYQKVYDIMDNYANGKDVSQYINHKFMIEDRQVEIRESEYAVMLFIGKRGVKYNDTWQAIQ